MDIESQLRENLVLEDPGTPFTEGVMSRLGDAPQGSSEGIVRLADERKRRRSRYFLVGVLVAAAAAATLALVLGGSGDEAVVRVAETQPSVVPAAAVPAAVPAPQPVIEPTAKAVPPPVAKPIAPPAASFSVLVRPVKNPDNLEGGVAIAQKFRDRLIAMLKKVPNLVLVDPADGGNTTVDYEVRLRLENPAQIVSTVLGDAASGMHNVLVDARPPAGYAAMDARIAAEAQMSPAELQRSQRGRQMMSARGRVNAAMNNGLPMSLTFLDQSMMPSPSPLPGVDQAESRAKEVVRKLRNDIFPVDAAYKQAALATLRNTSEPYTVRLNAQSDLLQIEKRDEYARMDAEVVRASADLALSDPGNMLRTIVWENILATRHLELIPQIARALDVDPDTEFRLRLVKVLATDYAAIPAARKVLEVTSRGNGQQVVRMAAMREVQGDEKWLAYVAASVVDTNLPDLQRLQPIVDMAGRLTKQAPVRLVLDDKALRELIAVAGRVAVAATNGSRALEAIAALQFVDNPALAERLLEIVRAPVAKPTELASIYAMNLKTAAIGVASMRFPDDKRFSALLQEYSESTDPKLSSWAKEQMEMMEAASNPAARRALAEKMLREILPK